MKPFRENLMKCIVFRLLLVSTLDGRLTALNIDDEGTQKWSVSTEPGPLLSSTIHNMEVCKLNISLLGMIRFDQYKELLLILLIPCLQLSVNSQLIRIIPSLSGGLYKFDGESIEPMPVNTDTLLRSYWDDVDISG